jgi:hypothetical protein
MYQSRYLTTITLYIFPTGLPFPIINFIVTIINYLHRESSLIYPPQPQPTPPTLVPAFNQCSSIPQSPTLTLTVNQPSPIPTLNLTVINSIIIIPDHSQLFNYHLPIVPIADFNGSEFFEPPGLPSWKLDWKISKYTFQQLVRSLLPRRWSKPYQLQLTKYI